jgi:hypothetical protein
VITGGDYYLFSGMGRRKRVRLQQLKISRRNEDVRGPERNSRQTGSSLYGSKANKGKGIEKKKGGNEARGCNTQYIQIVLMRAATKKKSPGWGGIVCQVGTAALLMQSCCRQQIAAVENYFLFHFVPILI